MCSSILQAVPIVEPNVLVSVPLDDRIFHIHHLVELLKQIKLVDHS